MFIEQNSATTVVALATMPLDHMTSISVFMFVQVFFAVLIGAFALGQALPNLENLSAAAGASVNIFETIDLVCFSFFLGDNSDYFIASRILLLLPDSTD